MNNLKELLLKKLQEGRYDGGAIGMNNRREDTIKRVRAKHEEAKQAKLAELEPHLADLDAILQSLPNMHPALSSHLTNFHAEVKKHLGKEED